MPLIESKVDQLPLLFVVKTVLSLVYNTIQHIYIIKPKKYLLSG